MRSAEACRRAPLALGLTAWMLAASLSRVGPGSRGRGPPARCRAGARLAVQQRAHRGRVAASGERAGGQAGAGTARQGRAGRARAARGPAQDTAREHHACRCHFWVGRPPAGAPPCRRRAVRERRARNARQGLRGRARGEPLRGLPARGQDGLRRPVPDGLLDWRAAASAPTGRHNPGWSAAHPAGSTGDAPSHAAACGRRRAGARDAGRARGCST